MNNNNKKSQQIVTVVLGGSKQSQTFLQNSNQTFSRFKISIKVFLVFTFVASEFPGFSWKQKYQNSLRSYYLFIIQILMLTKHILPNSNANLASIQSIPLRGGSSHVSPWNSHQIIVLDNLIDSTNSALPPTPLITCCHFST